MTQRIVYVTSSAYKVEEANIIHEHFFLSSGKRVKDEFAWDFQNVSIMEQLEVSIDSMVEAEVEAAYAKLKVPCMVEHAGLVFDDYVDFEYPGGLTKPMWNTLGPNFLDETGSRGRGATAKAVVAYCDGMSVRTFVGKTPGVLSDKLRGGREFYWDTVFIPIEDNPERLTYAEIVDQLSLREKVERHSQSAKAIRSFLEWRQHNRPQLWATV